MEIHFGGVCVLLIDKSGFVLVDRPICVVLDRELPSASYYFLSMVKGHQFLGPFLLQGLHFYFYSVGLHWIR